MSPRDPHAAAFALIGILCALLAALLLSALIAP